MDALQIFFRCYWPAFYFICLCLHLTMYTLIYHRTSRILTTLRYFLYPATTANFVLATLAFATQTMVTVTGLINLHTLCYRTMSLKYLDSYEADKATLRFSWHYLIPLVTLILSYLPPQNHANVYMETLFLHPDYNFEIYKNFGGFANSHHFCMTFNTFALALTTIYVPIIGSYWKYVALKILRSNISSMTSNPSRIMLETLIKGLSLQVLLPLCCYVPVTIVYVWNKYSGTQILISQYTLPFLGSLPCIFDPLLQIYFIMPYRTTIRNFFVCNPLTPISRQARGELTRLYETRRD
ncbi:hypothetical protein GCK72_020895 [Caenorhabditis remanei]|uniref:Serpentine Receptor, class D (Delta) n=1 Tax=Caenorhabditis remanei TaxID=31234 RepID=A0A6A5GIE8_CAERE|nr:hypothetical protein GCK72_020895 [Caenorhabditis remanei]KAF1754335.1 hypothetical protein GCK72_020895 [Caenorhabditis remanei]